MLSSRSPMGEDMDDLWRPIRSDHSIELASIILFFNGQFPTLTAQKLREAAVDLKDEAGFQRDQLHTELEIDAASGQTRERQFGIALLDEAGLTAAEVSAGMFQQVLSIEENSIGFRSSKYRSYTEFKTRFRQLTDALLPLVSNVMTLARIRFEYQDKYVWTGERGVDIPLATLIRANSPYIAPHIYKEPAVWHSHTGMVLPAKENGVNSVLQVHLQTGNFQRVPPQQAHFGLSLMSAREDRLNPEDTAVSERAYSQLDAVLDGMHDDLISAIREVLSDDMLSKIGLSSEGVRE